MVHSDYKNGLQTDSNPFFLAKTKCVLIHMESIEMGFIKKRKSQKENEFFSILFSFRSSYKV